MEWSGERRGGKWSGVDWGGVKCSEASEPSRLKKTKKKRWVGSDQVCCRVQSEASEAGASSSSLTSGLVPAH